MANKPHFSPAQTQAIYHGAPQHTTDGTVAGHNVLVSASAGSGKTTVLVERILTQILAGGDITRLLVVTFTKSAAAEMKARIEKKLKETLTILQRDDDADPAQRRHLAQQIGLVGSAPISTLDAFALQIVQQYFYVLELDPGFRVLADQAESQLIQESVWETVREAAYADDDDGSFAALNDNFASGWHDDQLGTIVFSLYNFAQTTTNPVGWMQHFPDEYKADLSADSALMTSIRKVLLPQLAQWRDQLIRARKFLAEQAIVEQEEGRDTPATDIVNQDIATLETFASTLADGSYTEVHNAWSARGKWVNWRAPGGKFLNDQHPELKPANEAAKNLRSKITKSDGLFAKNVDPLVQLDDAAITKAITAAHRLAVTLSRVTQDFTTAYQAEKKRRHALDFADVEHLALEILQKNAASGEPSVGEQFRSNFDEVLVDEYQDINELQEALLDAVSVPTPGNRFMVGDVKQSIYGFRLARPDLFMQKYNTYALPESDANELAQKGEHISLAENFRSSANILDFTNLIFRQVMDEALGDVDYDGFETLKQGAKDYPANFKPQTELLIYTSDDASEADSTSASTDDSPLDDEETRDTVEGQVDLTIAKIQSMMADPAIKLFDRHLADQLRTDAEEHGKPYDDSQAMRPLRYQDITLLVPAHTDNDVISERFALAGIPLVGGDSKGYFKTTELQVMLALLKVIDNPQQEIPLAAVLRSPIVGLTADELAIIRLADKNVPYYDALAIFMANFNHETATALADRTHTKLTLFLDQLTKFRKLARDNRIVDLIWSIYEQTGYLDYVGGMPGGAQRQANLHALYERAASYEQSGFKGLFAFVRFIEIMQQRDQDLDSPVTIDPDTDAVHLMTIHGSKGLQFPVVFLMNAGHRFNGNHGDSPVIATQHGIGLPFVDPDTNMKLDLPQKKAAKAEEDLKHQAEALRILYVALTRAEQRLIIVGKAKSESKAKEAWANTAIGNDLRLPLAARLAASSFEDLIGAALVRHPRFENRPEGTDILDELSQDPTQFKITFATTRPKPAALGMTPSEASPAATRKPLNIDVDAFFDKPYAFSAATTTTGFQAVSEIKQLFTDPDLAELNQAPTQKLRAHRYSQPLGDPQFLTAGAQESVPATAVGTATHALLQKLDLNGPLDNETIRQTGAALVKRGLFSAAVFARVNTPHLANFFTTPLGQLLQQYADHVHREQPFAMLLPGASLFQELEGDDQDILVHGIMDAYVETPDGLVLLDYKTDHIGPQGLDGLRDRYAGQLRLYAQALAAMTGQPVAATYLVALETGDVLAL